jgi:O-acetyl-ADP-ribose deacetylase (regulator of RNase III)
VIRVVVDDIAFVPADAIVRPATASLEPTVPALRRLEQIGGPKFYEQMRVVQDLEVGAAVVTAGGDLAAEFVIHAVIMSRTKPVTREGVRHALRSVIQRATDWQLTRITVPPVGTGAGNLSLEDAATVMIDLLRSELPLATYPQEVCIVVESEDERAVFEAALESMR